MPVRDEDLERALRESAPSIDSHGAFDRVRAKRARRRLVRGVQVGTLTLLAALVVVGGVVLLTDNAERATVTTPVAPVPSPGAEDVVLQPDPGWYLRGPLVVSGNTVSAAAYDRTDGPESFDFPPSRIVRFDATTLRVLDHVDLKAEILSVANGGDGVRWAVTRNPDPAGPLLPGTFLKRIAPDNSVTSTDLPPGTEIAGDVALESGSVWVPVRGDTLQFDLDGRFLGRAGTRPSTPLPLRSLPRGFVATSTHSAGARRWVEGSRDGAPTALLVENNRVRDVIALEGVTDASFAWVSADAVLATAGGRLLRIAVDG